MPDRSLLDRALESASRLAARPSAWVLFTASERPAISRRKVLLRRHSADPEFWGLPGGTVADDETAEQAARRWAEGQTGLRCGAFSGSIDAAGDRTFISQIYMAPLDLLRATNAETCWTHPDFALSCPPLRHPAARAALESIFTITVYGDSSMATTLDQLQRQVDALKRQIGPPVGDRRDFIRAQEQADPAYRAYGDSAPLPLAGETELDYRKRMLAPYVKFSKRWRGKDLQALANSSVLAEIEAEVYADAMAEAIHPTSFRPGQLRPVCQPDASGRMITRYIGDPNACWDQFNPPLRHVRRFCTPGR